MPDDKPQILWGPTLVTLLCMAAIGLLIVYAFYVLPLTAAALIVIKLIRNGRKP
jgi:hypothetical protein